MNAVAAPPAPAEGPAQSPKRAALWMLGAVASFSLMAIAGRELASDANTFQIMFWRSLVGAAVVAALISLSRRGWGQIRTERSGLHSVRNVAHFFGQNCWFYGVATIPLAQVFAFEFTTPIWVLLLGPFFLGERFTRWRAVAAGLGFVGVLVVAQPGVGAFGLGQAVAMAAALGFAGNVLATKRLSATESTLCILFWMTVSQAAMAFACDLVFSGPADALPWPDPDAALWLIAIGFCGLGAHFSMTNAFRHADASVVAPMDFFRLPLIAVVAAALYAEPLDPLVFVGGALVFLGNFLNIRAETRRRVG